MVRASHLTAIATGLWLLLRLAGPASAIDGARDASIAVDAAGAPHIAFHQVATYSLKYGSLSSSGTWVSQTVDASGNVGLRSSLALDAANDPHITYSNVLTRGVKYAKRICHPVFRYYCNWNIEVLPLTAPSAPLAVDSANLPHVVSVEYSTRQLKYGRKLASGGWSFEVVDVSPGFEPSIALDANNLPHIAYLSHFNANGYLKYARKLPSGGWTFAIIDVVGLNGNWNSIALDSADRPHIAYFYHVSGDLKYARQLSSGGWSLETVDSGGGLAVGYYAVMKLDSRDLPHIAYRSYYDGGYDYVKKHCAISWFGLPPKCGWIFEFHGSSGVIVLSLALALDAQDCEHRIVNRYLTAANLFQVDYSEKC